MSNRRLNGVLDNFLGTYTSRYTDYNGYWLFGLLVKDYVDLNINLMLSPTVTSSRAVHEAVRRFAVQKFQEQLMKSGFSLPQIKKAFIEIRKLPNAAQGEVNGLRCEGYHLKLSARVVLPSGAVYEREKRIFVAPHNPDIERRSTRAL